MLSFKINKKSSSNNAVQKSAPQISKRAFNDDDDRQEEEPDFIDGLDGSTIVSKKNQTKPEKKELIIPLIMKNEWRIEEKIEMSKRIPEHTIIDDVSRSNEPEAEEIASTSETNPEEALKQQAIKELLEGAVSNTSTKKTKSIPILFQNRVPDGYEEEDNMDVSLRPDQSTLQDYEQIPIEEFGLAMLRGMGWKETEGIGLKNKKVVDMAEPKLRPKGMGLGAEQAHLNKDVTPKTSNGTKDEEKEDLSFKIGGYAMITRGSKKGYYGQIESFDEDNNRVIIRLAISGKMEAISKFYINVVSSNEFKKSSKVINSEKYEEYKSRQDNGNEIQREERHRDKRQHDALSEESSSSGGESDKYTKSKSRKTDERNHRSDRDHKKAEREKKVDRERDDREREDKDRSYKRAEKERRDDRQRDYDKYDDRGDRKYNDDRRDDYRNSSKNGDRRKEHRKDKDRDHRRHHSKDSRD